MAKTWSLLVLSLALYARSHSPEDSMDSVKGVRLASRIPCDGSTNYRNELTVQTTFSPGGWERSFHVDQFEAKFCKYVDLYFMCGKTGHNRWREAWSADNLEPPAQQRIWLNSCSDWGSGEPSQYLLSGWYKEGAGGKLPWKQATLKQVSEKPLVYEFADSNGGTARVEIEWK